MPEVFLSIGSNLGDTYNNIIQALKLLSSLASVNIDKLSTFHRTKPVGGPSQPDYLNAAIKITTDLSPQDLLKTINDIENRMGRVRTVKDGPRIIDLDILLYNDFKIDEPNLKIPHPRMYEREFVLMPLAEIAPHLVNSVRDNGNIAEPL